MKSRSTLFLLLLFVFIAPNMKSQTYALVELAAISSVFDAVTENIPTALSATDAMNFSGFLLFSESYPNATSGSGIPNSQAVAVGPITYLLQDYSANNIQGILEDESAIFSLQKLKPANNLFFLATAFESTFPDNSTEDIANSYDWIDSAPSALTTLSCPVSITFTSQTEIDAFPINYPGCTEIAGNVIIKESVAGDITNLTGLSQLVSIGSFLAVNETQSLTSLSGLDNVQTVGGHVDISKNAALENLEGLGVKTIGGLFVVYENATLSSLEGLESLNTIVDHANIHDNPSLTSFKGLDSLSSIGGPFFIQNNNTLTSLEGLDNLTIIHGDFNIINNSALENLSSLNALTSIAGGVININNNASLTSLLGLDNLNPTTISGLNLVGSANLSYCNTLSICNYLVNPGNPATITGNAVGCNDRPEVEAACIVGVNNAFEKMIVVSPNPTGGKIEITGLDKGDITVFDHYGRAILNVKDSAANPVINISAVPPGIYFLQIVNANQVATKRIVKE